jgi:NADH-quinone oxidoreductase subunit J
MLMLFFALVAALSATSGVGVVLNRRPLYSALSLVVNMLSLALLFLLLSAQFLAAAQVIVYAGAVMVLFVFVIALLNPRREDPPLRGDPQALAAIGMATVLVLLSAIVFLGSSRVQAFSGGVDLSALGTIQALAGALYGDFAFPFEVTSLLLVVAAVGAIYLSRGR